MGENKQGSILQVPLPSHDRNPLLFLQERIKEVDLSFKSWLSKQSAPVEAAVVAAASATQGAFMGGVMSYLIPDMTSSLPSQAAGVAPHAMESLKQAQSLSGGALVQARNFAVMTGTNAGISCILKRLRGVEDVQGSMVAAFGSGVMFSLVSGMGGGPNPAVNAIGAGVSFALVQGAFFQLGQKFSPQPPMEDTSYLRTKNLLKGLGLEKYMGNFKKGMLTDKTLPLLTDSALSEVRIPPGPRLLILDHIQRDPEMVKATR